MAAIGSLNYVVDLFVSKMAIYKMLSTTQAMFNGCNTQYYDMVLMPRDHISVASIEQPQTMPFGRLMVQAPSDIETYLRHHYRNLRRYMPKERQQKHRPDYLSFGGDRVSQE